MLRSKNFVNIFILFLNYKDTFVKNSLILSFIYPRMGFFFYANESEVVCQGNQIPL